MNDGLFDDLEALPHAEIEDMVKQLDRDLRSLEEEFNKWYNEEHIFERLSVPGVLSAARYESVVSGPKHLAVYELESIDVLQSPEYLEL